MANSNWGARLLWTFLALLALTCVAGVSAIVFDDMPFAEEILGSTAMLSGYCLLALLSWFILKSRKSRLSILIGAPLLVLSLIAFLVLIWANDFSSWVWEERIGKFGLTCLLPGLTMVHRGLVSIPSVSRTLGRVVRVTALTSAALAFLGIWIVVVIEPHWSSQDLFVRGGLACALVATATTVGVFIIDRLERATRHNQDDATIQERIAVELTCPKCTAAVELHANKSGSCPACGLRLRVEFEEPRCDCGYLLYGLTGDVCPECGKSIKDSVAWAGHPPSEG